MATSTPREGPAARNDGERAQRTEPTASPPKRAATASPLEQRQQSAQVSFDTADKDKDGKITRQEATDVPNLNFSSADVNADASLSRQEFQTAMAGAQPRG